MLRLNAADMPAQPFPASVLFDDIGPDILAREDAESPSDTWQSFRRKMLPATEAETTQLPS